MYRSMFCRCACTGWLKKCPTGQIAISGQLMEIFLHNFQDLLQKEFTTILENFIEIFSLLQELRLLRYSTPYFKIMPKKWTVRPTCCVQYSASLSSFSQSTF